MAVENRWSKKNTNACFFFISPNYIDSLSQQSLIEGQSMVHFQLSPHYWPLGEITAAVMKFISVFPRLWVKVTFDPDIQLMLKTQQTWQREERSDPTSTSRV